ncbi:uncharacterized protein METZ01_LOCUS262243, partial [marine metagenome]
DLRGDARPRRRAGLAGGQLPAQPHPGRVDGLRASQALGRAAHRGRQHLRRRGLGCDVFRGLRRRRHALGRGRATDGHRPQQGVQGGSRRGGGGWPRETEAGRSRGRQPVRGDDGHHRALHCRPGHPSTLRDGRQIPAQHV